MAPAVAQGDVYRWVDENGQVHYSEKKDVAGSQVQALKISTTLPASAPVATEAPAPVVAASAPVVKRVAAARSLSGDPSLIFRQAPRPRGLVASSR